MLAALREDPGLNPSQHLHGSQPSVTLVPMQAGKKSHTHKNKMNKILKTRKKKNVRAGTGRETRKCSLHGMT